MEIKSFIKAIVQRSSFRGNEIRGLVAEEVRDSTKEIIIALPPCKLLGIRF